MCLLFSVVFLFWSSSEVSRCFLLILVLFFHLLTFTKWLVSTPVFYHCFVSSTDSIPNSTWFGAKFHFGFFFMSLCIGWIMAVEIYTVMEVAKAKQSRANETTNVSNVECVDSKRTSMIRMFKTWCTTRCTVHQSWTLFASFSNGLRIQHLDLCEVLMHFIKQTKAPMHIRVHRRERERMCVRIQHRALALHYQQCQRTLIFSKFNC